MKNGALWQPVEKSVTAPGGSALASARAPGQNGSLAPQASRTATLASAGAWVTASALAKAAADA